MNELSHILLIMGRIAAGGIGCIAFYVAFFLYPGEEGKLQNRIEDFWVAVSDRASETGNASTALFNRVASALVRPFNSVFGKEAFSLRLVAVSLNLSLFFLLLSLICLSLVSDLAFLRSYDLVFIALSLLPMGFVILSVWYPRRWIFFLVFLPVAAFIYYVSHGEVANSGSYGALITDSVGITIGFGFSLASDVFAVALIKRSLAVIADQPSFWLIARRLVVLGGSLVLLVACPVLIFWGYADFLRSTNGTDAIELLRSSLTALILLNTATLVYCLIPIFALVFVLCHRMMWPILSRLLFPIARFEVLKNRKAMAAIGSLGILVSLGLKPATLEAVLKLFE